MTDSWAILDETTSFDYSTTSFKEHTYQVRQFIMMDKEEEWESLAEYSLVINAVFDPDLCEFTYTSPD